MNILPGEPVPPGFEDEVNRVAEIQKTVDDYNAKTLVGIEYTLELHENDRHEPGYLCTLCDKRGDPRTIIAHWTSYNHRLKYLEKHYPTAVREFNPIRFKPNSQLIVNQIVQSLTKAIEDHHGRLRVAVYNADDFRRMRTKIIQEITNKFHYDERNGPNFLNIIDRSLWERVTPGSVAQQKQPTLLVTLKNVKRSAEAKEHNVEGDLDEISSDSDNESNNKKQKIQKEQGGNEKKLPTPKELSLQASHIAQERYKWEKYRCMLEIQLKQIQKQQQDFEINPEKHPLYPEEWKKFWNQRYKELQLEGKVDPNKYDYKPEWIVFWTKRMKKLHDADIENKKKELKIKLGLPENAEEKVEQLRERYKVQVAAPRRNNNNSSAGKESTEVINISDGEESPKHVFRSRRSRSRSSSRSRSRQRRSYSSSPTPSRERNFARRGAHKSRSKSPHPRYRENEIESTESYYQRHSRVAPHHGHSSERVEYLGPHSRFHHSYNGSYRVLDSHQIPKYTSNSHGSVSSKSTAAEVPEEEEGPLTVVSVLRLVIALEDHLGSLGHKVVDMLGKALALEKVKANSADDLLLNEDHVVFFETIKEKLRGLLIADVIEDIQKQRAVKKAIMNIAKIIHQVTNSAKGKAVLNNEHEQNGNNSGNSNSGKTGNASNNELPFDRQLVASKLAAALVVHGREDITSEQMDRLIQMVLVMVKLNKARMESEGKIMRMRDIRCELGLPTKPETLNKKPDDMFDCTDFSAHSSNDTRTERSEVERSNSNNNMNNEDEMLENADDNDNNSSILESLSDPDLQTLLNNFKHLSTKEQHHLIVHLKRLERTDPQRVEKLRKYVNLNDIANESASHNNSNNADDVVNIDNINKSKQSNHDDSPPGTSNYRRSGYSDDEDKNENSIGTRRKVQNDKFNFLNDNDEDDDDDDYNFDEVFKAASRNVNRASEDRASTVSSVNANSVLTPVSMSGKKEPPSSNNVATSSASSSALTFNPAGFNVNLKETQNLIANLMGSLQQSNAAAKTASAAATASSSTASTGTISIRNLAPVPVPVQPPQQQQHRQQQQQQHMHHQVQNQQHPQMAAQQNQHPQQQAHSNMPYFQQQQQTAAYAGAYDPNMGMNAAAAAGGGYYNQAHMGYGNNAAAGYGAAVVATGTPQAYAQPWGANVNAQAQWQNYGMPIQQPQQPQQATQQPPVAGYNMYGRGGN